MKKLLMTTILASSISFTAIADVTKSDIEKGIAAGNSAVCNTLDHGIEFNKTELSQFDKCWLSIHKAEEKSGVSGNIFWVKVGDEFVSMPIKALAQAGSKVKAKEVVKTKVIEKIVEVESGTIIDGLRIQIEDLELAELDGLRRIAQLNGQVRSLNAALTTIRTDLSNAQNALNTERTRHLTTVNDILDDFGLPGHGDIRSAQQAVVAEMNRLNAEIVTLGQDIVTITAARDTAQAALSGVQSRLDTALAANTTLSDRISALDASYNLARTTANTISTGSAFFDAYVLNNVRGFHGSYDNTLPTGSAANNNSGFSVGQDYSGVGTYIQTNTGRINLYAGFLSNYTTDRIEQAIEEAYDSGYSDGYEQGYKDGYADGFTDGVNSTR